MSPASSGKQGLPETPAYISDSATAWLPLRNELNGSRRMPGVQSGYGWVVRTSMSSPWSRRFQGRVGAASRLCMPLTTGRAASSSRIAPAIAFIQFHARAGVSAQTRQLHSLPRSHAAMA